MPAGLDKGLVAVRNAGDATNRLFLLEQDGQVWAWDGDQVHSTPFLDIKSEVTLDQYSGLFGLVFHPDYATNGHFFVNYTYTTDSGAERMRTERFTVLADDPNLADLATRRVIIEYENDNGHHNGGDIAFGPDGFLYIAMGDSGGQEDPFKAGQNFTGPSSSACPGVDMVDPQLEYDHSGGQCSITGGYRYRGAIKGLQGIYIYADLCSSEIFFAEQAGSGAWNSLMWSKTAASYITSFGEDEAAEILIVQYYGDLLRFAAGEKLPPK